MFVKVQANMKVMNYTSMTAQLLTRLNSITLLTVRDDNQEHYVIIKNSDHVSGSNLERSKQIAGANSSTRFRHKNKILRPAGSGISTIVSMECASTDVSTNVSWKFVSTDISNECVSSEYISTDVSMESASIDASTGVSTDSVFTDISMYVSTKFVPTNIHSRVYTDNKVIRYTNIFTNVSTRIFMDVPTTVNNNTTHDIDNNNEHKDEDILNKLIEKLRNVSGQKDETIVKSNSYMNTQMIQLNGF